MTIAASVVKAQDATHSPDSQNEAAAEKAFKEANAFMDKRQYREALVLYKQALTHLPDDPSLLFNGGLAAYLSHDYATAVDLWKKLKELYPNDGQARIKLVQAYQALGNLTARDTERKGLFELRQSKADEELTKADYYCREQFEVAGKKLMVFEHFELKGERALRYVFTVLNEAGNGEEYRLSLGSYELTNTIWRESTKPTPKEGERLFHLDGYYKWGHATYGMYVPEPSYDAIRKVVINILEGKDKPVSSSTVVPATKEEPTQKKKP